jgi:hypothetical protein
VSTNTVPVFDPTNAVAVTDVLVSSAVPAVPIAAATRAGLTDPDVKAKPEAWWKARMRTLTDQLAADELPIRAGADRVAMLRANNARLTGPAQATIFVELQHAEADQDRLTSAVDVDKELITSTEEMARSSRWRAARLAETTLAPTAVTNVHPSASKSLPIKALTGLLGLAFVAALSVDALAQAPAEPK